MKFRQPAYNHLDFTDLLLTLCVHFGPNQSQLVPGVAESEQVLGGFPEGDLIGGAMQQNDALTVDYGPTFYGAAARTDKGIVCVVPIQARDRPEVQASMRELVTDLGGECGRCRNCPLGCDG